jgi:hypothetical protein
MLFITDGKTPCSWARMKELEQRKSPDVIRIDVCALGMSEANQRFYADLAHTTRGEFLNVDSLESIGPELLRYGETLRRMLPQPIELRGFTGRYRVLPGQTISLPAGPYSVVLPPMEGLPADKRKLSERIRVKPGESRNMTVTVHAGEPTIH